MPHFLDLGAGLEAACTPTVLGFRLARGSTGVECRRRDGRITTALTFAGNRMRADVSLQPGAVVREIDQSAREQGVDPNRWRGSVLAELRRWSGGLAWCPAEPSRLLDAVGALTHPLLAQVYSQGRQPLGEIPRWATTVLRCPDAAGAARELTGTDPNRRLVRSLAHSLLAGGEGGPVGLQQMALAVIARNLISLDETANLLDVAPPVGLERLASVDDVKVARQGLGLYPVGRRAALLLDVACHHDAVELARVMTHLWWVRDRVGHPLPVKLDDLKDVCRRLVTVLAPATVHTRPTEPIAVPLPSPVEPVQPAQPVQPSPPPRPHSQPLAPPARHASAGASAHTAPTRWPVPAGLLPVHQRHHESLHFTVPTSTVELTAWGLRLHNCLASYASAMAEQRSWLIGIERDDALVGCVEVVPSSGAVRQALGARNRPLTPGVHATAVQFLREQGVIRTSS